MTLTIEQPHRRTWPRKRIALLAAAACFAAGVILNLTGLAGVFVIDDPRQVGAFVGSAYVEVYGPEGPTFWVCVYPDEPAHSWETDC